MTTDHQSVRLSAEEPHLNGDLQQWLTNNGLAVKAGGQGDAMSATQWIELAVVSTQALANIILVAKTWTELRQTKLNITNAQGRRVVVDESTDETAIAETLNTDTEPPTKS